MMRRGASIVVLLLLLVGAAGGRLLHQIAAHGTHGCAQDGCSLARVATAAVRQGSCPSHAGCDPRASAPHASGGCGDGVHADPARPDAPDRPFPHDCTTCELLAVLIGAAPSASPETPTIDDTPSFVRLLPQHAPEIEPLASLRARPPPVR